MRSAGQLWAYLQQEEGFPARCPLSLASAYVTIGRVTDSQRGGVGGAPTLNPLLGTVREGLNRNQNNASVL